MYCKNCGAQISEGSAFCTECGKSVQDESVQQDPMHNQPVQPPLQPQQAPPSQPSNNYQAPVNTGTVYGSNPANFANFREIEKQSELEKIDNMINYFTQRKQEYDEYDACMMDFLKHCKRVKIPRLIVGIALVVIFGISIFSYLSIFILIGSSGSTNGSDAGKLILMVVISIIILCIPLGVGIMLIITFFRNKKAYASKAVTLNDRIEELNDILATHYNAYGPCQIGLEYTNPQNLYVIKSVIISGRATNTTEALNVCLDNSVRLRSRPLALWKKIKAIRAAKGYSTNLILLGGAFVR